jgi:MioC protein
MHFQYTGHIKMKLKILVGSMTHTAEHVAKAIQTESADLVSAVELERMDGLDIHVFDAEQASDTLFLVCISTYGAGDVPDNAQLLFQSLDAQARYLGHVRYGVIALGDRMSHSETYGFGGIRFDERLQDLGAQRIGDIFFLDSSDGTPPEAKAAQWCREWLKAATPGVSAPDTTGDGD